MKLTLVEAYEALSISQNSSAEEVKKAYKKLALRTHPDKNPNDPEAHKRFLLISEAYKRITDPSSFQDDEDDLPNEEEMEAMFNMMFAEMMGMNGMGEISPEMFAAMEDMMMNGAEDDDVLAAMMFGGQGGFDSSDDEDNEHYGDDELLEMLMHELMRPEQNQRGKFKSGKFKSDTKSMKMRAEAKENKDVSSDSDDWETDSDEDEPAAHRTGKSSKSPKVTFGKSGKLSSNSGSFRLNRSGSRRIPPRASSGKFSSMSGSPGTDGKVYGIDFADAKGRSDSLDEKFEDIIGRRGEAKGLGTPQQGARKGAAAGVGRDAKGSSASGALAVGDRVLVQNRYAYCL